MTDRITNYFMQPSLRQYLILIIVGIILLITGVLCAISYLQAEGVVLKLDEYFQEYTELNIRERISLVNSGLNLYDSGMDRQLQQAFIPYLESYRACGGDLSCIDFPGLQQRIDLNIPGTVDLYVINRSGIIIRSTVPDVLYLNLSQNPDYQSKIPLIMNGSVFVADRVVNSYSSAQASNLSGTLRKFAFMPTDDHEYLLEIGVSDISFSEVRTNLSYYLVSDEMSDINPYLDNVRIFDIHKNLFVKGAMIPSDSLDSLARTRLDEVIASRSDRSYTDVRNGSRVRYLFIDQGMNDSVSDMSVIVEVIYSNTILVEEMNRLVIFFSGVGLGALFLGVILTFWSSRVITLPISDIVEDVDQIARGDLDHRIRSMAVREFSRLEQSITMMIGQIRRSSEEIEHRKTEMSIAADIQQSFLPETIPPVRGYEIAARTIPVKEVGGDFYDIIPLSDENDGIRRFGILIADVSGKGVPAALFMALSRTIMRVTSRDTIQASCAVSEANTFITADARSGMFVTLFYGVISEESSGLTYVNAGHNPPVYYHAGDRRAELLHEGGIVLGIEDSFPYLEETVSLHTGDIIVMYTDGITEAIDGNTAMYGEERLCEIVRMHADEPASEIIEAILHDHKVFTGAQDQFDDITIVVIKKTDPDQPGAG